MELNAEINKVFGQEMAKIFSEKIPEEELEERARFVYKEMLKPETDYWGKVTGNSQLTELIKNILINKTTEFVKKELEKPENEEILQERAKHIVANAKKVAEEELTAHIAQAFFNQAIQVDWSDFQEEQIVKSMLERLTKFEQDHGFCH